MHIAQKEYNRLISYINGLGITIVYKDFISGESPAELELDEVSTIKIALVTKVFTYTDAILALLHELGHYQDWVNTGKRTPSDIFTREPSELNMTERKVVYESERKATVLSIKIAEQLELKYPATWRIKAEAAYDRWMYRAFVNTGKYPDMKTRKKKDKQLKVKYKGLNKNE